MVRSIGHMVRWMVVGVLLAAAGGMVTGKAMAESWAPPDERVGQVGVAEVEITPDFPVRLNGYGGRRAETDEVVQPIYAKALAIGGDDDPARPAVLVTADQCIVPAAVTEAIADRLEQEADIPRERFTLSVSHSHTTPMLTDASPTIFGEPIPESHQANIDRYTAEFIDRCVEVAKAALADREPAEMAVARGSVGFALNRRALRGDPHGPNDHEMPTLIVRSPEGDLRAVYVLYACHCTVLSDNFVTGDWAGYAQEHLQEDHPEAIALVSIGCGADQNPYREGRSVDLAETHGREIADEVSRLLRGPWRPIEPRVSEATYEQIPLAFDEHPSRAEWEQRAEGSGHRAYHAQRNLERLDEGETLPTELDYPIQTWQFGSADLAMVFLAGEVVVDYALRLKRELDAERLWVTAYANDVPCYIPSERVLREGGYEGVGAMSVYDQPAAFAPGLEDEIIAEIHRQLGDALLPRTSSTR